MPVSDAGGCGRGAAATRWALALVACMCHGRLAAARVFDIEADGGAVPDDDSLAACWKNGGAFNATLKLLQDGDTLLVPNKTFHMMGGIMGSGLRSVTLVVDGTIVFSSSMKAWPRSGNGPKAPVLAFLALHNVTNLTITSSHQGASEFVIFPWGSLLAHSVASWHGVCPVSRAWQVPGSARSALRSAPQASLWLSLAASALPV